MRKLVFLALASMFLLSFSMPGVATAKAPTPFTATIFVWVQDPGNMAPAGVGWRTTNEVVLGQVVASDWDKLQGAAIQVSHSSNTLIGPDGRILLGHARASFTVVRGASTIVGNYRSAISGDLAVPPETAGWFSDEGGWDLLKGAGDYQGVESHGKWQARLELGPILDGNGNPIAFTYRGFATLSGTYH
ncbi:MAG: hypothetical protein HYX92_20015 [Chloroflexi bacterium]|nr:hypothetical protein [Chloroflexota bacterium]